MTLVKTLAELAKTFKCLVTVFTLLVIDLSDT